MAKNLVIVESPAKAKKINAFLGKDYIVKASVGHVRDLPAKKLGVDVENGFEPEYTDTARGKKVLKELRETAKKCEAVYLAPDPDREGEAIAWHLFEALKKAVPEDKFYRVTYNEITKPAILKAFEQPAKIDMNRVDSQQARRVLDRLVGYVGSPVVRRQIRGANSVGRVQTVALRLVVEREREIQAFNPEAYWVLGAEVRKLEEPLDPFTVRLSRIDGEPVGIKDRKPQTGCIRSQEQMDALCADLEQSRFKVLSVTEKEIQRRPRPPFITSSLQQAGSSFLSYAPSRTMRVAQKLYEAGLITYMRTDSFNIAQAAREACRSFVQDQFGAEYVPPKPNVYKSKGAAQEAHEAIRPTDVFKTPNEVKGELDQEGFRLYELIWKRFAASQMVPARITRRSVELEAGSQFNCLFRASSSEIAFPGYMKASGLEGAADRHSSKDGENGESEETALPPLREGEALETLEWLKEQKETRPPARYSEAALIRALEENGVGRPSTYAAIMSKLDEREYVVHEKRALVPTPLGMMLIKLVDRTAEKCRDGAGVDLFDVGFTAEMEEKLDRVELGKVEWRAMLESFYPGLLGWIEDARETADPQTVQQLLEALRHVRSWEPPVKRGRRTYDDAETVADLRRETAEGKKLSGAQGRMLHALACRYMDQIPAEFVNKLELTPPEAPRDETASKLNLLAGVECEAPRKVGKRTYDDRKFIKSLQRQVDSRKRLSEKQVAALDRLLMKYADQIENFEQHKKELRLADPVVESDPNLKEILGLMDAVDAWNPPKGKFDDRKFFESLRSQFDAKGGLSPRQTAALKKMVRRYADQIPNYAQKAEPLGLPAAR